MKAPFFVEILGRGSEVRLRQRLYNLPIRIGRAYDNDVILDDRHTSPHHAEISLDEAGQLHIRDLGSRNGIVHRRRKPSVLTLDGDTVFRLGHTSLRVRPADYAVAKEMQDTTRHTWEGWPPALTGVLLMALMSLFSVWSENTESAGAAEYITVFLSALLLVMLWSSAWTLANRLSAGQLRFGRHLFIAAAGLAAMDFAVELLNILAYSLSLAPLSRYAGHAVIAVAAGVIYFHLCTINPLPTRRFAATAVLLAIAGSGLMLLINYQNGGRFAKDLYMGNLQPPALHLTADKSVDDFLSTAQTLKAGIDAERAKAAPQGSTEDDLD